MQLKKYTDYALRVLIFSGMKPKDELTNIKEISEVFGISTHHLGKIVHELNKLELLKTVRGRGGGFSLMKDPEEINVGLLIRHLENDFNMVECFDKGSDHCVITPACTLKHALNKALHAFFRVLDEYTLKDLITNEEELRELMGITS